MSTTLPPELWLHILSYLSPEDLSNVHQTGRFLKSVCEVDSLWEAHCRPVSSPAPFDSYRELYTQRFHNWRWLEGVWCGDQMNIGHVMLCRYNGTTGRFDFHRIEAEARVEMTGYSLSPFVDVTRFYPRAYPNPQPSLSLPHSYVPNFPLPSTSAFPAYPDHIRCFRQLRSREQIPIIGGIPEEPIPTHCRPRTSPPHIPRLKWMSSYLTFGFSRNAFLITSSGYNITPELRRLNPFMSIFQEEHGITYSRLSPSWMRPAPDKPYQGLWIGEYSTHGVEMLLFLQRIPTMLEVIKVQGDSNVPRGEYSFVFPDLSSLHRRCTEVEFEGSTTTLGYGQIAGTLFREPTWIPVEGILVSHDEIFVAWGALRHISNYKRVNLEEMLKL